MDNTSVVQYELVQGCLNYVYIIARKKLEWRRAPYSKINYDPLGRLTLCCYSFVVLNTQTRTHALTPTRTQVNIEQDNIF